MLYHLVCPTKYRRVVIGKEVDQVIKETCVGIGLRYDMHFVEIGTDEDHVHFLIQSVPMVLPSHMVRKIKSITGRAVFERVPQVKKQLWGGEFWSNGYYISTVGKHGSETAITQYVKEQGQEKQYQLIHKDQLKLFLV